MTRAAQFALVLLLAAVLAAQAMPPVPKLDLSWNDAVMFIPADAIALSALPAKQRRLLVEKVGDLLVAGEKPQNATRLRLLMPSAMVKLVALGGPVRDAVVNAPEYFCGAAGNCPVFIFAWTGSRWRVLLAHGGIDGIILQPAQSHGYRDIVLWQHWEASDSDLRLYRFDGSRYTEEGCWQATWAHGDEAPPDLTPCGYR